MQNLKFFSFFFLASLLISVTIRNFIIPRYMPSQNDGSGLLLLTDSSLNHKFAIKMAEEMKTVGWDAWQLRAYDWGGVSISFTAIVYRYLGSESWWILSINSLVHALSGLVLIWIFSTYGYSFKVSAMLGAGFVFWPSTYTWVAQILRDGYFCLGYFLIFFGVLQIFSLGYKIRFSMLAQPLVALVSGFFLTWLARPSFIKVYIGVLLFSLFSVTTMLWFKHGSETQKWRKVTLIVLMAGFLLTGHYFLNVQNKLTGFAAEQLPGFVWAESKWLPKQIDDAFREISESRYSFRTYVRENPNTNSLDSTVGFENASQFIFYLPRAVLIGLFSPFPHQWFKTGKESKWRRFAVIPELLCAYVGLFGLFFLLIKSSNGLSYLTLLTSLPLIVIATFAVTNLGALYRYKFPFWYLLVALGIGYIMESLKERLKKTHSASLGN